MPDDKTTTIDCTPSWEATMNILMFVLLNGTPEGAKAAADDLRHIGRQMDCMVVELKTHREAAASAHG